MLGPICVGRRPSSDALQDPEPNEDHRERKAVDLGNRLWLRCNECGHSITSEPREFVSAHHLDIQTPLRVIARRLKCSHCNERKAHCWPEPYGIGLKRSVS
jgi:hypothetical protein